LTNIIILDLFGGLTSQIPGAINVDRIAAQGIRTDISIGVPFHENSVDEIIAS
jgi:filamentous hemagglutinin